MNNLIEIVTKFWTWFMSSPEAQNIALGALIALFPATTKVFKEIEIARAKGMYYRKKMNVSEITDRTRLTVADVAEHVLPSPDPSMNTNRKKIQRAVRMFIRGWLR